jgi:hypothetical protein
MGVHSTTNREIFQVKPQDFDHLTTVLLGHSTFAVPVQSIHFDDWLKGRMYLSSLKQRIISQFEVGAERFQQPIPKVELANFQSAANGD